MVSNDCEAEKSIENRLTVRARPTNLLAEGDQSHAEHGEGLRAL
jgi:hypothetical protein